MDSSSFNIPVYDIRTSDIDPSSFLGNNAKGMMVLLGPEDFNEHRELLEKILAAVNYDLAEDAIVVLLKPGEKLAIRNFGQEVHHLLLFGLKPSDAGLSITNKRRLVRLEQLLIVRAPTLGTISKNTDEKRKLWEILKSIFVK